MVPILVLERRHLATNPLSGFVDIDLVAAYYNWAQVTACTSQDCMGTWAETVALTPGPEAQLPWTVQRDQRLRLPPSACERPENPHASVRTRGHTCTLHINGRMLTGAGGLGSSGKSDLSGASLSPTFEAFAIDSTPTAMDSECSSASMPTRVISMPSQSHPVAGERWVFAHLQRMAWPET